MWITVHIILKLVFIGLLKSQFSPSQFATEAAITILRIDDMIKLIKDERENEE